MRQKNTYIAERTARLGLSLLVGVVLGAGVPRMEWASFAIGSQLLAWVLSLLLPKIPMGWAYSLRNLVGWLAWWGWVGLLAGQQVPMVPKAHNSAPSTSSGSCLQGGLVLARIYRRESAYRYRVQIEYDLEMGPERATVHLEPVRHGAILVFSKNDSNLVRDFLPKVGDFWLIEQSRVGTVPGPRFFGDPDLRSYYRSQGIERQITLGSQSWGQPWKCPTEGLPAHPRDPWDRMALFFAKAQENLALSMDAKIRDPVGRGLAQALLLGWKAGLDPTTKTAFQQSGTIHLLAVSGMHVLFIHGWVLLVLGWLYRRISLQRKVSMPPPLFRFLGTSLPVLMYCWLTGGASSAWRAGLVLVWMEGNRAKAGSHHGGLALFQAAACMLALDADAWLDPGFVLSFGAVVGLQWLYQPLAKRLFPSDTKTLVVKVILNGLLTICAQIVTSPITLYYFKQFPAYFLPANLLVVPLSGPLLLFALGWSLTGNLPYGGSLMNGLGRLLFGFTHSVTNFWGGLPGAVWQLPDFDGNDSAWMGGLILLFMVGLQVQTKNLIRWLSHAALIVVLSWQVSCQYRQWTREARMVWTYQPMGAAWGLWSRQGQGVTAWINADSDQKQSYLRRIGPYGINRLWANSSLEGSGLRSWKNPPSLVVQLGSLEPFLWVNPKEESLHQTLLVQGKVHVNLLQKVDLLILHQGARANWTPKTQPGCLVLSGYSNRSDFAETLKRCHQEGIPSYDLRLHPPP
ncbi:MAG: ComEC/Rec2 family competence protein [Bacteroidia bacterium]